MNIDKSLFVPTINPATLTLEAKRALPVVKVGAILDVLVADKNNRQQYQLKWGKETLSAHSDKALEVGSRQLLRVTGFDAQGRIETATLPARDSAIARAIQQRVAVEQPLSRVFGSSSGTAPTHPSPATANTQSAASGNQGLAQTVAAMMTRAALQKSDLVRPESLKQSFMRSGLFFESQLGRGALPPANDLKRLLIQLTQLVAERGARQSVASNPQRLPETYAPPKTGQPAAASSNAPSTTATSPAQAQSPPPAAPPQRGGLAPGITGGSDPGPLIKESPLPTLLTRSPNADAPLRTPVADGTNTDARSQDAQPTNAKTPAERYTPAPQSQQFYKIGAQPDLPKLNFELPQQILRALESGLARLEIQQLASLQAREHGQVAWLMEMPVKNGENVDVWQFYLRNEDHAQPEAITDSDSHWLVSLAIELEALGSLAIHIDHGAAETSVSFFSTNSRVLELINSKQQNLAEHLRGLGISQSKICAHFGELPEQYQPLIEKPGLSAIA